MRDQKNQLASEEAQELQDILSSINADDLGHGWDKSFIEDFRGKFEQYGARTYVSPKQWVHLRRIRDENTKLPSESGVTDEVRRKHEEAKKKRNRELDDEVPF